MFWEESIFFDCNDYFFLQGMPAWAIDVENLFAAQDCFVPRKDYEGKKFGNKERDPVLRGTMHSQGHAQIICLLQT